MKEQRNIMVIFRPEGALVGFPKVIGDQSTVGNIGFRLVREQDRYARIGFIQDQRPVPETEYISQELYNHRQLKVLQNKSHVKAEILETNINNLTETLINIKTLWHPGLTRYILVSADPTEQIIAEGAGWEFVPANQYRTLR